MLRSGGGGIVRKCTADMTPTIRLVVQNLLAKNRKVLIFMIGINYQQIVSLLVEVMTTAYPIVIIFLVTEKIVNLLTAMMFGKEVKI